MRRFLVALLVVAPALKAGDPPLIVIRKPDAKTKRDISRWVSNKGIGGGTRKTRSDARSMLTDIGPWAVIPLSKILLKRAGGETVLKMNAAITLTMIGEPLGLPALRHAAGGKSATPVRQTACLALGRFAWTEDRELLTLQFDNQKNRHAPAAALALAKLKDPIASGDLLRASESLPRDSPLAAATLLAAAVASPKADCVKHFGHKDDLVRRAAVTGLLIRPLTEEAEEALLDRLQSSPRVERSDIRRLQFLALAKSRSSAARRRLLKGALKDEERKEVRIAALIGLCYMLQGSENYEKLRKEYRKINSRSDPLAGPFLFAMSRTGHPDAEPMLLKIAERPGEEKRAFYAMGSLVYQAATHDGDNLLKRLARVKGTHLEQLRQLAQSLRAVKAAERFEKARVGFRDIDDPDGHFMWAWNETDRGWHEVNRLLPLIFELDDLADRADIESRGDMPGGGGGGEKRAAPEGRPQEQDLLDFLAYEPYFSQEDLGGR